MHKIILIQMMITKVIWIMLQNYNNKINLVRIHLIISALNTIITLINKIYNEEIILQLIHYIY